MPSSAQAPSTAPAPAPPAAPAQPAPPSPSSASNPASAAASPSAAAVRASAVERMRKDMSHHAAITDALLALQPRASLPNLPRTPAATSAFAFLHDDPQHQQRSPPRARSSTRSLASFSAVSTAPSQTTSVRSQKSVRFADPPVSFTISRSVFDYIESDDDADSSSNEAPSHQLTFSPPIHIPARILSDGEDDLSDFGSSRTSIDGKRRLTRSSRRVVSDLPKAPHLVDELDALRVQKSSSQAAQGASSAPASASSTAVRQPRSILKTTDPIAPPSSASVKKRSFLRSRSATRTPSLTNQVAALSVDENRQLNSPIAGSMANVYAFNNHQDPTPSLGKLVRTLSNSSLLRKKKNLTKDDVAHRARAINF
ncbi:hypothetical protein HDU83_009091 [Entophlyctis luteolus]|nr:hypothetical protein HDU83_009091 [Entophlyctis luteolus]